MEALVVLYFIDLTFGSVGQGCATCLELARWFRVSKPTVVVFMRKMAERGLVETHAIAANRGNGFVVKWSMTKEGKELLDYNFDAAYDLYRIQVEKTIAAIKAQKPASEYRKLSKNQRRGAGAGQKELL